jgi:formylglycine-generating enzyme required for sulfatase activity
MRNFVAPCLLLALSCLSLLSCASVDTGGVVIDSPDNPGMVVVPEGWFYMGSNSGDLSDRPEHEVYLPTFLIDKYEVSAREFADFLNAEGNPDDEYFSLDKYSTITAVSSKDGTLVETSQNPEKYVPRKSLQDYPANNVSWFGADAYCRWKGKHLPTEAEWEKAARGKDKRTYPWGNSAPDSARAVYDQKWDEKGFGVMAPVDSHPEGASYYGALNMAGNVWEWVADWYRQSYCDFCDPQTNPDCVNCYADIQYDVCVSAQGPTTEQSQELLGRVGIPEILPVHNPTGPSFGTFKVLRGGSWYDSYGELVIRSTYRYWFDPSERYFNIGFRCAK